MNIQAIKTEWKEDAALDILNIEGEIGRIPKMHEKYLGFLTDANMSATSLSHRINKLKNTKRLYYGCDLDIEEVKALGWEPIDKIIPKSTVDSWLAADDDLNDLLLRKQQQEEIAEYARYVLKEINNRSWQIRALIDYKKFSYGG